MTFKTILTGRLEFGSPRSFEQVLKMFEHRIENFYKADIFIDPESVFQEEDNVLDIPRLVTQSDDKTWRNTVSLLEFVAQYAIAGSISAWMVENGKLLRHATIEPKSDKSAIKSFLKGRELVGERGREDEAKRALSRAIEKFARHALAYERRGFVNYRLENMEDALHDFTKSIQINPNHSEAYVGRAKVYMRLEKWEAAIEDLVLATRNSIPLQPIYWRARRMKGECHLALNQYDQAITEYKLFTRRPFGPKDPNFPFRKKAFLELGRALLGKKQYQDAVKAFSEGLKLETGKEDALIADQFLFRGIAIQKSGEEGYRKDWKEAANRGSKRAAELLETSA